MKRKGQAAMEFLMTYGWAILVVLAAIAALAYFGVLSPGNLLPERTTFTAPLPNVDNALVDAEENSAEIAFRNNVGVRINVTGTGVASDVTDTFCENPTITVAVDGGTPKTTATISNGEGFLIKWECPPDTANINIGDKFEGTLGFDYVNMETGQTRTQTGTVSGKYQ